MTMQDRVSDKLTAALELEHFEIFNESHRHNVPSGSESHFKVVLVSQAFEDTMPVKRHQLIYKILSDEMQGGIHALALHTYTPGEWNERKGQAPDSPDCRGGSN
ncbi:MULTISPECIES: BolA family transcriptional regulator [unclassified Endozoicomonas]|uniref:BolA family protein n=1 Tax=unclassified Endozoicomonas TaxID=2644528 RepID=UPI00214724C9|nr:MULTISPECIES: BolA/IbaG family iron-sulfur metabolism protein [unclassified Endozoicomonas]